MLKLTYTENSFNLEYIDQPCEAWVNTRVVLALRSGCNIHIQNTTASFTVQSDSFEFAELAKLTTNDNRIDIYRCDIDSVEITLKGMWISSNVDSEEGVFITALNSLTELHLLAIKQNQHSCYSI